MKLLNLFLFFLLTTLANAQTTFQRFYNYSTCDQYAEQITEINNNNFIFLTYTNCNLYGQSVDLIKINQYGDTLATEVYSVGCYAGAGYFIQSANSFLIPITGTNCNTNAGFTTLLKIDTNLQAIWYKTFSFPIRNTRLPRIIETSDGGYILGGETNFISYPNYDLYFIKLNSNGDSLWSKIVSFNGNYYNRSIIELENGTLLFTGSVREQSGDKVLIYLTDSLGDSLMLKKYDFNFVNEGVSFNVRWRNNFVVGGYLDSLGIYNMDGFLLFLDSNLDSVTTFKYNSGVSDMFTSATSDSNEFVTVGLAYDSALHYGKQFLMKFDTNFTLTSNKFLSCPNTGFNYSYVSKTSDNGLIIGTTAEDPGPGYFESALLMKTDNNGDIVGIPEIGISELEIIYPNPSKGKFYINGKSRSKKGTIYSILGNRILEFTENDFDLSSYEEGIYIYEITFYDGLVQKGKLIKVN